MNTIIEIVFDVWFSIGVAVTLFFLVQLIKMDWR